MLQFEKDIKGISATDLKRLARQTGRVHMATAKAIALGASAKKLSPAQGMALIEHPDPRVVWALLRNKGIEWQGYDARVFLQAIEHRVVVEAREGGYAWTSLVDLVAGHWREYTGYVQGRGFVQGQLTAESVASDPFLTSPYAHGEGIVNLSTGLGQALQGVDWTGEQGERIRKEFHSTVFWNNCPAPLAALGGKEKGGGRRKLGRQNPVLGALAFPMEVEANEAVDLVKSIIEGSSALGGRSGEGAAQTVIQSFVNSFVKPELLAVADLKRLVRYLKIKGHSRELERLFCSMVGLPLALGCPVMEYVTETFLAAIAEGRPMEGSYILTRRTDLSLELAKKLLLHDRSPYTRIEILRGAGRNNEDIAKLLCKSSSKRVVRELVEGGSAETVLAVFKKAARTWPQETAKAYIKHEEQIVDRLGKKSVAPLLAQGDAEVRARIFSKLNRMRG